MNAINLYINACRLVMHGEVESKEFCMEVYKLLPSLRQSLSCTVCGKLLSEPYTPTETLCQHHVCKKCIGNKKRLKPSCSWCKNYERYVENNQIKLVIKCYIKLCNFMEENGIIKSVCSHLTNGGHCSIREIVDEVVSNNEDTNKQMEIEQNLLPIIDTALSPINGISIEENKNLVRGDCEVDKIPLDIKIEEHEVEIYEDCNNDILPEIISEDENASELSIVDSRVEMPLSNKIESIPDYNPISYEHSEVGQSTLPSKSTNTNNVPEIVQLTTNPINNIRCPTNLYDPNKSNSLTSTVPIKMATNAINSIHSNIPINLESTTNVRKIESKLNFTNQNISIKPSTSSLLQGYTIPSGMKQIGIYNSILDTSNTQPISHISPINSIPNTTVSCMFSVPAGTIFSGNTKQTPIENTNKVNIPMSNSSYSVMYCDSDNTKITFKRKPPDIENINNSDQFKIPQSEVIKKIRPKPKQKPKRKGCRCGNATPTPGKLTCCGQRCPCYVAAKACIECQCRGCRNPHRPGGKKVRPIIPQFENIKIHQIQPVHPRPSVVTSQYQSNNFTSTNVPSSIYSPNTSPLCSVVPTIRTLHAVPGIGSIHTVSGGMHHLINIGSRIVDPNIATNITIQQNQELAMKQLNLNIPSIPTQYILNDDQMSNQSSDINDLDIDVK